MKTYGMAGHLIRRLNQISTQIFTARLQEAGYDLTPVQFAAMEAIALSPGIDQAGVAARIAYDRATIGGVIDRLVQKGLVERRVARKDRRAREVRLSHQGQGVLEECLPIVTGLQDDILAGLDAGDRAAFVRLATRAIAAASGTDLTAWDTAQTKA